VISTRAHTPSSCIAIDPDSWLVLESGEGVLGLGVRAVLRGVLGLVEPAFLREAPAGDSSDILSNERKTQELLILRLTN
jgi:hypothetical protein